MTAETAKQARAFVVAAPSSGSGKTTVTLALLGALGQKGLSVQAFKCGPDFIDPTLHRVITGRPSRNLDLKMCGKEYVRSCFAAHSTETEISVVEGVMGLYDGGEASTAAVALTLNLPVLLVLDAGKMAESAAAVVKGFETLDPSLRFMGVILNNVGSTRHLNLLVEAIRRHCSIPVLGHFPRTGGVALPERHLGLHMGQEGVLNADLRSRLEETALRYLEMDGIIARAGTVPVPSHRHPRSDRPASERVRIAVAMDRAFCFYYEDNLDLLQAAGAELLPFSPLADSALPENISALYLGGGYPELHAKSLSENRALLESVKRWVSEGGLTYAECGGFMYLTEAIHDLQGNPFPMAGCFPTHSRMKQGRVSLGYRNPKLLADSFFGPAGTVLDGHEFHYSYVEDMPGHVERIFGSEPTGLEGYRVANTIGSYLHAHFGRSPIQIANFIDACRKAESQRPYRRDAATVISTKQGA